MLHNENMVLLYRVKQGIALNARSDWVLKLRISFALYLRTMCAGFAPVIFARINELKLSFCAVLSHCFSVLKQLFTIQVCPAGKFHDGADNCSSQCTYFKTGLYIDIDWSRRVLQVAKYRLLYVNWFICHYN